MTPLGITLILTVVVAILYQSYLTARVARHLSYTPTQKGLQITLIWLLPIAGAAVVHAFCVSDREIPVRVDKDFTPQDDQPVS